MRTVILFIIILAAIFCDCAYAEDREQQLKEAQEVALSFVKADADRDWRKAYNLLWRQAQVLWNQEDYAKYLESSFQKKKISDPIVAYSSLHPDSPGFAFVLVRSSAHNDNCASLLLIRQQEWRVVYAEPLISSDLGRKATFESLQHSVLKKD